jgi:serine O-acetyltransferase
MTNIGKGFQFLHFGNVVFNPSAIIGENCTITQGVLIGQSNRGVPEIGDCVWIGANAILVGGLKLEIMF